MAMLMQGAQQAIQAQDCEIAMQVCQMLLELAGGGAAPAEAAPAEAAPAPAEPAQEEKKNEPVVANFKNAYVELEQNQTKVYTELTAEENKFRETLRKGEAEFQKLLPNLMKNPQKVIPGRVAFRLYDTFGFPIELTEELAAESGFKVDIEGFKEAEKKHQEASKTLDAGAAKGGLAEHSDTTTKYHTATHILHQALHWLRLTSQV